MSCDVTVLYFASLREAAGCASECVRTDAADLAGLYEQVRARHGFAFGREQLRVAVADAFVAWETPLPVNGEVAFIPPVSGG